MDNPDRVFSVLEAEADLNDGVRLQLVLADGDDVQRVDLTLDPIVLRDLLGDLADALAVDGKPIQAAHWNPDDNRIHLIRDGEPDPFPHPQI